LFDDVDEVRLGVVDDLRGFFVGNTGAESWFDDADDEVPYARFDMLGLVPDRPLQAGSDLGEVSVEVLADDGEPIGFYQLLSAELERTWQSADGTLNATLAGWFPGLVPDVDAEKIWDAWRSGPPASPNLWAELPPGRREAWLEVVSKYRQNDRLRRAEPGRSEVVLDGRHVTDLASFYCAVGEAVNGPGGYFRSNPMALEDCLSGGWGVEGPFTLVWTDSDVARAHLGDHLDVLLGVFHVSGTDVILR